MKINITVEATASEVREALGLPDVRPLQEKIMQEALKKLQQGVGNIDVMQMVKPMLTAALPSVDSWQKLLWSALPVGAAGNEDKKPVEKDKSK